MNFRGRKTINAIGILLLFGVMILSVRPARAGEFIELTRSGRMSVMGGAGVALADDVYSRVWVNPAGLAGVEEHEFHPLPQDIDVSVESITTALNSLDSLTGFNSATLNALIGKNVYARATLTPTFIMPGFAIAGLLDQHAALYSKNLTLPTFTYGYQTTNGIQASYGMSLMGRRKRKGRPDFRFGLSVKWINRRGGYRVLPTSQLFQVQAGTSFLKAVVGGFGSGWGVDAGTQYVQPLSKGVTLMAGAAWTEIGDLSFGSGPSPQQGNVSVGLAAKFEMDIMDVSIAYDYRHINEDTDFKLRNHFGVELGFPILKLYGGFNQVYLTYGAGIDLWRFKLFAGSYAEELGVFARQDKNRRYIMRMDFFFNL